jgi:hypothetical protein
LSHCTATTGMAQLMARWKRRELVAAGLVTAAQPACAQGTAQGARVNLPCPSQAGDIVGVILEGSGASAGTVVVFGQAFRPGHLPNGAALGARTTGGGRLRAQADVRTRHPDGSARFAVVSVEAPAIRNGSRLGLMLTREGAASEAALDVAGLLNGRSATLFIGVPGGPPRQIDLLALLRTPNGAAWQSGPLAVQNRVMVPVEGLGATSMRLVADIALRADRSLWVEAWLRNDGAMRQGGRAVTYNMRLALDGREALKAENLTQQQYTGWGRLVGTGSAPPFVRHDATYLADAGVVARYDITTGVTNELLNGWDEAVLRPDWSAPLGNRHVTRGMFGTGGRPDIGPATQSQAVWLMTMDRRAATFAIGQAESAGSIPWHFWELGHGWLDTRRWPRLWTDGRGGSPPGGLAQQISSEGGWEIDAAHQPDLAYVPYLLTGRRAFLDELQAQATWCVLGQWPGARGTADRPGLAEGVNVIRNNQVRGAAWSMRQLDEAAWATPDEDPHAPWVRSANNANWAWLRAQIPAWTSLQGEAHGWIMGEYGSAGVLPPWQQDYFASTAAAAARRGSVDAHAVLVWMSNFLIGRFTSEDKGMARNDGAAYLIAIEPEGRRGSPYQSWREIGQATQRRDLSNGKNWNKTQGDYAQLALLSLASIIDVTNNSQASVVFSWLSRASAPFTQLNDYRRDPVFNVVPREVFRGNDRTMLCIR